MARHKIYLIGGEDDEFVEFIQEKAHEKCTLTYFFRDKKYTAEGSDYFEALCVAREELEKYNLIPFCYGASLNVFPSRMARQMGNGLMAYKTRLGEQALREDLVGIFSEGADIVPATVDRQKEFFISWMQSLESKKWWQFWK